MKLIQLAISYKWPWTILHNGHWRWSCGQVVPNGPWVASVLTAPMNKKKKYALCEKKKRNKIQIWPTVHSFSNKSVNDIFTFICKGGTSCLFHAKTITIRIKTSSYGCEGDRDVTKFCCTAFFKSKKPK